MRGMQHSPTFLVQSDAQKGTLENFQRRDQHLSEEYQKNKPLCFSSRAYQMTHPEKARKGHQDADATLASPMMLGVADGVSQVEEYGIDPSVLPHELLGYCEGLAASQLIPGATRDEDVYRGPVQLLRRAFESTESLGSTTCLLALLDNSTKIHGKLHPMVAVITVGDCELLLLRRFPGRVDPLQASFHTEMQRLDGHVQTPLQLARVDARIDPEFTDDLTVEVIERGSAVHCISAYEGDIVVMGSDGVFDNLFIDEVVSMCNSMLPPRRGKFVPTNPELLAQLAQRLVEEAHSKATPNGAGRRETPIGKGGKVDDTACVVAEIVEWTEAHSQAWEKVARAKRPVKSWKDTFALNCGGCDADDDDSDGYDFDMAPQGHASRSRGGSQETDDESLKCRIS
eukprot:TRINITY_DN71733_c0_g1_i1.p1 TRINITY_DN71733_c0_g1~~TRINITY_DN71733_c0_g1_i1.p1  ORF type:complete len:399 (-),score=78.67 TRINITY_DN71733_c0_g1_i1:94-1290(-)